MNMQQKSGAASYKEWMEEHKRALQALTPLFDNDSIGNLLKIWGRKLEKDSIEAALRHMRRKARMDLIKRLRSMKGIPVMVMEGE